MKIGVLLYFWLERVVITTREEPELEAVWYTENYRSGFGQVESAAFEDLGVELSNRQFDSLTVRVIYCRKNMKTNEIHESIDGS